MSRNLEHFETNDEYSSQVFSKLIDSKRGRYLNFWKVLLQNTIRQAGSKHRWNGNTTTINLFFHEFGV